MANAYSSHTHSAESSLERAYEICSYQRTVHNTIVLHGSLTATGIITFTLMESGAGRSAQETFVFSTWTDSTPIFNQCGRRSESWSTFSKRTVSQYLTSSPWTAGEGCRTEPSSGRRQVATIFWHELQAAIQGITWCSIRDYESFVIRGIQRSESNMFHGGPDSMSQANFGNGSCP